MLCGRAPGRGQQSGRGRRRTGRRKRRAGLEKKKRPRSSRPPHFVPSESPRDSPVEYFWFLSAPKLHERLKKSSKVRARGELIWGAAAATGEGGLDPVGVSLIAKPLDHCEKPNLTFRCSRGGRGRDDEADHQEKEAKFFAAHRN